MSEQQPLSNKEALEQALNTKAEPAWDPIYKDGQEFRLDPANGMPGVELEVFEDHEVVRVTTSAMVSLTFPTRAAPQIEDGAVVFTNREGRLIVPANGRVRWERLPETTDGPAPQTTGISSTSDLDRQTSGPQKGSEAVVPAQQGAAGAGGGLPDNVVSINRRPVAAAADRPEARPDGAPQKPETGKERVELTGRLGKPPTFYTTAKGTFIGSFPLGVHLEDGSTTWHTIVAFKDKARKLQEHVTQGKVDTGKEVDVVGYVHYREKPSKKGKTRRVREIWAAAPVRPR